VALGRDKDGMGCGERVLELNVSGSLRTDHKYDVMCGVNIPERSTFVMIDESRGHFIGNGFARVA
jgi:hypothetical protein